MERIAIFPGTFDPVTKGHESVVRRALPLFDRIVMAIGMNSAKTAMFPIEQRMQWIRDIFKDDPKVVVKTYEGLTVNFCKNEKANFILRGLRTHSDFEYEKAISQMNLSMAPEIETVFLITEPAFSAISSTIVREIIRHNGDVSRFIPKGIQLK
ncbi:MAG TPA: pantetheine-phosphate adenylyltransferase [Flavobacteriales bacterium]|nr:pantetheine-phosphate adenylyltransferase [Flavobacteriales bacterium]HRE98619.1 pantetheine-phosphate adenylyltransferase [Flavobacteriales bacterium]HRJ37858.1 pantetheine-phosphate adenylyltransferase [Flavobacteriales bacterium]